MAATHSLPQRPQPLDSSPAPATDQETPPLQPIRPRRGVVTLSGYGIQARVERGHLILEDGIGSARRWGRFPRVGHGLERLVVVGADGVVSLAALRWLADQNAAFVMLERDGTVLATTGPVRPSDVRLRRAQALAAQNGTALRIAQELISKKIAGQELVAREKIQSHETAAAIAAHGKAIPSAKSIDAVRLIESRAAQAYWSAWSAVQISFPKNDLLRIPNHWKSFGARSSPLSGSPRLAVNPANAILNYLYALLEAESRLAAAAMGLDPGLGMLHLDTVSRDSLACDLMEPVRPQVDSFLFDWVSSQRLKREWFFEQRNGNCRLMTDLTAQLSETVPAWRRAVAPWAEWIAQAVWSGRAKSVQKQGPPTRLTQSRKREAKGVRATPTVRPTPRPKPLCQSCGGPVKDGSLHCPDCVPAFRKENLTHLRLPGVWPRRVRKLRLGAQKRCAGMQLLGPRGRTPPTIRQP